MNGDFELWILRFGDCATTLEIVEIVDCGLWTVDFGNSGCFCAEYGGRSTFCTAFLDIFAAQRYGATGQPPTTAQWHRHNNSIVPTTVQQLPQLIS